MMRIIAGKAKGRHLETLEGMNTRPTLERTKEAVFSMLQFDLEGRRILDLFAGSGQMGLEALSRGAAEATFVDQSKEALAIVKRNVIKTGFETQSKLICADALHFITTQTLKKQYDLLFLDPPYASELIPQVLKKMKECDLLTHGAIIVCETENANDVLGNEPIGEHYIVQKTNRYGKAFITILNAL